VSSDSSSGERRLAPLAQFSSSGSLSPEPSPRGAASAPVSPKGVSVGRKFLRSSGHKLRKLLSDNGDTKRMQQSRSAYAVTGQRSQLEADTLLVRAQSTPNSPRHFKPRVVLSKTLVSVDKTINRTRPRSRSYEDCHQLSGVANQFTTSLHSFERMGNSLASTTSSDGSGSSVDSEGKWKTYNKKRFDEYVKATAGGSPQHGTSATLELDSTNNQPIVRVRSHSSADELRARLREQSVTQECDLDIARRYMQQENHSDGSKAPSKSVGSRLRYKVGRRHSLRQSLPLQNTYTLIEYNQSMLGLAEWDTIVVPNDKINNTMRTHLQRASRSDSVNKPYRVCKCRAACTEHVSPDASAKLFAIFLVDPDFMPSPEMRPILSSLLGQYNAHNKPVSRGELRDNYLVRAVDETTFASTPITYRYRFRMFF